MEAKKEMSVWMALTRKVTFYALICDQGSSGLNKLLNTEEKEDSRGHHKGSIPFPEIAAKAQEFLR